MKLVQIFGAMAAILWSFSPVTASSQVPESALGIWSSEPCESTASAIFLGKDYAVAFETTSNDGPTVSMGAVRWVGSAGAMTQHGATTFLPPVANLTECDALPSWAYASMAEAIALLLVMDELTNSCTRGNGRDCAESIFAFADVSDDNRISIAEMTRLVRAASVFTVYQAMSRPNEGERPKTVVPIANLTGASVFLSLTAPIIMRSLVSSYDFDGDGFLTLDEVMQDREALLEASIGDAAGSSLGTAFVQALVSKIVELVISNAGQLAGPITQGLFR